MEQIYDVIIIGSGPAGCTAALYCARAGLDTLMLEKAFPGGQMALTGSIENYPGFESVEGYELSGMMHRCALAAGAKTKTARIESLSLEDTIKTADTSQGRYLGRCVIIATGAAARKLSLPSEEQLLGRGVHYCATCDGAFYRGKTVVVVGGGNSAVAEALHLSKLCKTVILVHRRDTLRADHAGSQSLHGAENIQLMWNSTIAELLYDDHLTGVVVRNVNSGKETRIACDGLFVSIGRKPATELVMGKLPTDEQGYLLADESTRTQIPGVFAAGDVRQKEVRQIVTATADGAAAAHYAQLYLAQHA